MCMEVCECACGCVRVYVCVGVCLCAYVCERESGKDGWIIFLHVQYQLKTLCVYMHTTWSALYFSMCMICSLCSIVLCERVSVRGGMCVRACVCARVCACVCMCVHVRHIDTTGCWNFTACETYRHNRVLEFYRMCSVILQVAKGRMQVAAIHKVDKTSFHLVLLYAASSHVIVQEYHTEEKMTKSVHSLHQMQCTRCNADAMHQMQCTCTKYVCFVLPRVCNPAGF